MSDALWLIGFRAAGKTTLGRQFANRLGWRFRDLDESFEARHGSILAFVDRHGVERFRMEEEALLREAAAEAGERLVLATGGGFVDREGSRRILVASPWPKVWLDPPATLLWERLSKEPSRKKIGDLSSLEAMTALLEKRRPFYEKIATYRLESQDISECLALLKNLVARL